MKHAKDRVIALDYFRGICILMIVLSHSALFSNPFTYILGGGILWTGGAEMFFLLSGLTYGIVRSQMVIDNFRLALRKTWRRSIQLYFINCVVVILSATLALLLFSRSLPNDVIGNLPTDSGLRLIWHVANFSYTIGWANFLMYYAVYLLFAPFLLYGLKKNYWLVIPVASVALYLINVQHPFQVVSFSLYSSFATWQLYFVMGMTIANFRSQISRWFTASRSSAIWFAERTILYVAGFALLVNIFYAFNMFGLVERLTNDGWLPVKLRAALFHLNAQEGFLDSYFMNGRTGLLRPAFTLMIVAGTYILYQRYKGSILKYSGKFVMDMGKDTLWIFVAQAFAIPLLAVLPIQRNIRTNFILTSFLILSLWALTKRKIIKQAVINYLVTLKEEYYRSKEATIYRLQDEA